MFRVTVLDALPLVVTITGTAAPVTPLGIWQLIWSSPT
jgi:hypothetical protein